MLDHGTPGSLLHPKESPDRLSDHLIDHRPFDLHAARFAHVDLGQKLLLRFAGDLSGYGTVEGHPKLEGRNAHVLISPVKALVKSDKPEKSEKAEKPTPPAAG